MKQLFFAAAFVLALLLMGILGNIILGMDDNLDNQTVSKWVQDHSLILSIFATTGPWYDNLVGIAIRGDVAAEPEILEITDHVIKNNIAIGSTYTNLSAIYGGENDGELGSGHVYLNNCFGAESNDFIEWGTDVNKDTYDAWETAYGGTTASVEADPLFIFTTDFHLKPNSPAIDAGTDVSLTSDYVGAKVPQRSTPSIGAYEYIRKKIGNKIMPGITP